MECLTPQLVHWEPIGRRQGVRCRSTSQWCWPPQNVDQMVELLQGMPDYSPSMGRKDVVKWTPNASGVFTSASAYHVLAPRGHKIWWTSLVWYPQRIPRYSFILWLVFHKKLCTKDRVAVFAPIDQTCVLCGRGNETVDHLFLECAYVIQVWRLFCKKTRIEWPNGDWTCASKLVMAAWNNLSTWAIIGKLSLFALAYHIWFERNSRVFKNIRSSFDSVMWKMWNSIRVKLFSISFHKNPQGFALIRDWEIQSEGVV